MNLKFWAKNRGIYMTYVMICFYELASEKYDFVVIDKLYKVILTSS